MKTNQSQSISRKLMINIRERLQHMPVVAILGPRQVGKTTLARRIVSDFPNAQFLDLCVWQKSRDSVIAKFTPTGQATAIQIMKDLQYVVGAAIQPLYNQIRAENPTLITQLETTDNLNFQAFYNFLGYGNY